MAGRCPRCGRNTVKSQFSEDIAEEFTWCTYCHWEPEFACAEEEDDDEAEY